MLVFSLALLPLLAQAYSERFMFVDENGNVIPNGARIVRNVVEVGNDGAELINSGISVKNVSAGASDALKMLYNIERLDNGTFQICFPTTCNYRDETGSFETNPGQLMGEVQDIMSEWLPVADGTCIVTLSIQILSKGGFPPTYTPIDDGPSITVEFVKGAAPGNLKGDVDGDGEVGISDVNTLIDRILSSAPYDAAADVDADGEIAISDVNAVIDIILSKN